MFLPLRLRVGTLRSLVCRLSSSSSREGRRDRCMHRRLLRLLLRLLCLLQHPFLLLNSTLPLPLPLPLLPPPPFLLLPLLSLLCLLRLLLLLPTPLPLLLSINGIVTRSAAFLNLLLYLLFLFLHSLRTRPLFLPSLPTHNIFSTLPTSTLPTKTTLCCMSICRRTRRGLRR